MELKTLRVSKGKTQQEIATAVGISQRTYSSYENKETFPTEQTLLKLADYFQISVDMLLGRPRPNDLPFSATPIQREIVKLVLELNESNSIKALGYCSGLLANQ